nr:nucleotidyltransferase domain-containing protein [Nostoc spongiaeforme]
MIKLLIQKTHDLIKWYAPILKRLHRTHKLLLGNRIITMGIEELLLPFREEVLRIASKYGAYNLRVFGSVARDEARPDSDVDFLVELEPGRNLLDRIGLMQD